MVSMLGKGACWALGGRNGEGQQLPESGWTGMTWAGRLGESRALWSPVRESFRSALLPVKWEFLLLL